MEPVDQRVNMLLVFSGVQLIGHDRIQLAHLRYVHGVLRLTQDQIPRGVNYCGDSAHGIDSIQRLIFLFRESVHILKFEMLVFFIANFTGLMNRDQVHQCPCLRLKPVAIQDVRFWLNYFLNLRFGGWLSEVFSPCLYSLIRRATTTHFIIII